MDGVHEEGAMGRGGEHGVDGRVPATPESGVVRGSDTAPGGVPAELTAADLDAIAHHPRVGYPKLTPEQIAEVLRRDEERWQRSRGLRQRAPSPRPFRYR